LILFWLLSGNGRPIGRRLAKACFSNFSHADAF
jgi:hypothetical protein